MALPHPVMVPAAGLTSGGSHVAFDRWDPVKESNDYSDRFDERRIKSQIALPVPSLTSAYTNADIEFSHPTNRPLLACNGLPRNFKIGNRCVNPLEPRYMLPGCSQLFGSQGSPKGCASVLVPSPSVEAAAAVPSSRRPASERLLIPAMSIPRAGDTSAGALSSPKLQPLASQSISAPSSQQSQPTPNYPNACSGAGVVATNGAVGGLLLYGPQPPVSAAGAGGGAGAGAWAFVGNRNLDVADINGQPRSTSVPPRRNGGFDPLYVTDIVPPRKPSPTRQLSCLTTSDIKGASPRRRTREVASPGRGTLNSADIAGAAPGCRTRVSPTTYALGRWPAPAVPQHPFSHSARVTMLKKPITIGE